MKRLAGLSALALMISSISGCSWIWGEHGYFRDRGSDYLEARQVPPMQVPEGLSLDKHLDPLLPIPRNVPDEVQTSGEYQVPRPLPLQASEAATDYTLQKNDQAHWILSEHAPAETWPVAHQFFEDNGFRITEEHPQTGEFSTAWQRYDELSASMAKRLQGAAAPGDGETRVRVRIEPGVQRDTSEVYVTTISRPAGSTAEVDFPKMPSNAGTDLALVDEMLASMTRSAQKGGSVSLLAARDFDAPSRVTMSEDGSGNPMLNVGTDLDRAWSSVGRALDHGTWKVEDINRSLGLYYINMAERPVNKDDHPGFFSRLFSSEPSKEELEARAERYQVRLSKVAEGVQVTVEKNINTVAPPDVARRVLSLIQDNLG